MAQLLISVTSVEEASIALECGVNIIDLKDPAQGALGALPLVTISEIVAFIDAEDNTEKTVVSATVGDLPMDAALLVKQVLALAETGVDIVKIGFFKEAGTIAADAVALAAEREEYQSCLEALSVIAKSGVKLIAVLFIEYQYPLSLIAAIKQAGFYGLMLDTANKNGAIFLDYFPVAEIKEFAKNVRAQDLFFGLAGSLNLTHVTIVKEIAPDYIGFRGGVCMSNQRKLALDPKKIRAIREVI